jgi:Fe-S-cluster-containing hydrogenase component 2
MTISFSKPGTAAPNNCSNKEKEMPPYGDGRRHRRGARVCPERAVHPNMQDIHHMYEVIEPDCTGCADCLSFCPEPGALVQHEPAASC